LIDFGCGCYPKVVVTRLVGVGRLPNETFLQDCLEALDEV
jgi:hypothetical protein